MKNNEHLFDQITIMKSNPHYRLGDIIFQVGARWKHDHDIIANNDNYKNTILRTYIDNKKINTKIDEKCLSRVIKQFGEDVKTDKNTLYINIRLGDVVTNWDGGISAPNCAGKNKSVFIYNNNKLLQKIRRAVENNNDINHIQFVTSLHFGDNKIHNRFFYTQEAVQENRILFDQIIKKITTEFDQSVSVHNNQSADQIQLIDQHVLILSCCRHVIYDNSGFGQVVRLIRQIT